MPTGSGLCLSLGPNEWACAPIFQTLSKKNIEKKTNQNLPIYRYEFILYGKNVNGLLPNHMKTRGRRREQYEEKEKGIIMF